MHIDGKETSCPVYSLPFGDQGLSAINPGGVQRINEARVELQGRAGQDLISRGSGARVGIAQAQDARVIEICRANVATRLAAVGFVSWLDVGKGI